MKFLHVCSNYYPAHGGPQYTLKDLSEKLIAYYKDEVEVATSNSLYDPTVALFKKISPSHEVINQVRIHRFSFRTWHYRIIKFANRFCKKVFKKPLLHSIRKYSSEFDCPDILRMMKHTDADVIMATTSQYMFTDYPLWRFKTKNPKPFVLYGAMHLHIQWPADSPILRRAKICDCYIANTEFEREWLIEHGVFKDNIVTIGTGIEIDDYKCSDEEATCFRRKNRISDDDILIGYMGRLSEGKGAGLLIDAFNVIYKHNKKTKLIIAGTATPYISTIRQKIKEYNLPVILIVDFNNTLKPVLFNALDIFVLASKGESFGVVFLEAWACKKPVIGVNTGVIASLISNEQDGLLFETGNANDLADKLSVLINDKVKRAEYGMNGFLKVQSQYTWTSIVEKYRNAYINAKINFQRNCDMQNQ